MVATHVIVDLRSGLTFLDGDKLGVLLGSPAK